MKNVLKFMLGIFFISLILLTTVSARADYNRRNYNDEKVVYVGYGYYLDEWENEDRYPLYDYRWGYSYRTSYEYPSGRYARKNSYRDDYRYNQGVRYDDEPSVKYVYVDYLRTYEKRECYVNPPRDKLFYIKC